jgi:hypothetical protein
MEPILSLGAFVGFYTGLVAGLVAGCVDLSYLIRRF